MPPIKFEIDDFKLIELVKQNQHLYDKNHAEYHDLAKRSLTWQGISVALGTSAENCRKRFRCLRDRFTKEKRTRKIDMLNDETTPLLFKKMMFIWDHLQHRSSYSSHSKKRESSEIETQIQILEETLHTGDESDHSVEELGEPQQPYERASLTESSTSQPTVINLASEDHSQSKKQPKEDYLAVFAQFMKDNEGKPFNRPSTVQKLQPPADDRHFAVFAQFMKDNEGKSSNRVSQLQTKRPRSNEDHSTVKDSGGSVINLASEHQSKRLIPNDDLVPHKKVNGDNAPGHASEQQSKGKKPKLNEDLSTVPSQHIGDTDSSDSVLPCNEAFCAVVKDYLDQIQNPVKLSLLRIQILTILHNELFSKR